MIYRGLIQDHVASGVKMTCKDTFLTKTEFQQLLYVAVCGLPGRYNTHTHTYINMYIRTHTHVHACVHTHAHTHTHTLTHIHVYIHVYIRAHANIH